MRADNEVFEHPKSTITFPTHDFCHLVVAAHQDPRRLPWRPMGTVDSIKIAEYNTVGIEKIYRNTRAIVMGLLEEHEAARDVLLHQAWYAGTYHHPFPEPNFVAAFRWSTAIRDLVISRFFPTFVTMAAMERHEFGVGNGHPPIFLRTDSDAHPLGDELDEEGRAVIMRMVRKIKWIVADAIEQERIGLEPADASWFARPLEPYKGAALVMNPRRQMSLVE